ncbi:hypothetical protein D1872_291850 [compost metagenome]
MQTVELLKARIKLILQQVGILLVLVLTSNVIHLPQHTAPEAIRPPIDTIVGCTARIPRPPIIMLALNRGIGNFIFGFVAYPIHFVCHSLQHILQPFRRLI